MDRARENATTGARPAGPSPGLRHAVEIMKTASRLTVAGILVALDRGEAHPGDLAREVQIALGTTSNTLTRLRLGGLVERRREANHIYYSLTDHGRAVVELNRRLGGD